MKLTFILCFFFTLSLSARTYSQRTQLTLNLKNARLEEVLDAIRTQSDFSFWYKNSEIDLDKLVTIEASKQNIEFILDEALKDQGLSFTVFDKHIVLYKAGITTILNSEKQQLKVTGSVTDAVTNEPLIGVSISVEGAAIGVITDVSGKFSLDVPGSSAVLVFTYVGYVTEKVSFTGQQVIDVKLSPDIKNLQEVVVVGYGTAQRKNVVGSIDQVKAAAIEGRPVTNLTQALQGNAPGLVIQQKNMEPGSGLNLNVRGISTINNNDPLVVIDGLVGGDINALNPNDVESISVLKDAGSSAIFGSRSANGVILVTTKKGKKNSRTVVALNALTGYETPHVLFEPVKGYENAILRNQALINGGAAPIYTPEDIRLMKEKGDNQWFLDAILKNSFQQNYNLSISGGNERSTYMLSAGYLDQASNFVGPDYGFKRYNFRMNMTNEYGKLKLTTLMAYSRTNIKTHSYNSNTLIVDASRIPDYYYYSLKDAKGRYLINDVLSQFNPLGILEQGGNKKTDNDNFSGNISAELGLFDGLKLKGIFGGDLTSNHSILLRKQVDFYSGPEATKPSNYYGDDRSTQDDNEKRLFLNSQVMLDYSKTIDNVHLITALFGASNESSTRQGNSVYKTYTDPDLNTPTTGTLIDASATKNTPENTTETSLNSLFGRAGYSYKEKYLFEVDFRYDGSSKFEDKYRWGFFPSVSGGWRLSEESFLSSYKDHVGDLKLRASYGILGNQNVDDYSYQTTYSVFDAAYGFNNSVVSGTSFTFGNNHLQWEKAATFNIGTDASFLRNKLILSFDYFNKLTSDILLQPEVPKTLGGAFPKTNAGKVRNQGWEVNVNYHTSGRIFSHTVNFNIADSWNKVVDFLGKEQISGADQMQFIIREGLPIASYYGYKRDGYFQNIDEATNGPTPVGATVVPGDIRYKDKDGNGVIDDKDRYVLGNAFPRYTFGLSYQLGWKGFDMSFLIQGVAKRKMFLRGELIEPFHSSYSYVMYKHQLDFWTPVNPGAKYPRLSSPNSASDVNNYGKSSDLYVLNAAYLRVKNIQVGYTLPANLTRKAGVQKCRLYLTAQNLFTISGSSFIDPESTEFDNKMTNSGANSGRNYPTLIYYGCGLDLNF
jgi:TonB-linked SusC/RagA family outer membrane protein